MHQVNESVLYTLTALLSETGLIIRSRREEYANNYTTVPQLLHWLTQSVILPFEVTIIIKSQMMELTRNSVAGTAPENTSMFARLRTSASRTRQPLLLLLLLADALKKAVNFDDGQVLF